jgi:hypothetical protein
MTKAIEDELGLPRLEDALRAVAEASETLPEAQEANEEVERMSQALANVDPSQLAVSDMAGTETLEAEMNDVITTALQAHKELMDMGFNMEPKNAGQIFTPATRMLEIAMAASKNKAEQRMKAIKIKMEKEAHDREMRNNEIEGDIEGEMPSAPEKGWTDSRDALIRKIKNGEI